MIIAIDETGSFRIGSKERCFYVAVHIRQRKTLYKIKCRQFSKWEKSLPRSLKNSRGEIKSFSLSDDQLFDFCRDVVCAHYYIGITPFTVCPSDNPVSVIDKYRKVNLVGICEGTKEYSRIGKDKLAKVYSDFGHWLAKLSYPQYLKILVLGQCIAISFINTVGHSIAGGYDEELTRIKFLIDRDFIKEPEPNSFWHELLRNQLYCASKNNPLPLLDKWKKRSHPFIEKYTRNGKMNFNELFRKNCSFVSSHENYEVRIADAVNTVISRYINKKQCRKAYGLIRRRFLRDGRITQIVLNDFDLESWNYNADDNPWK